MLKYRNWVHSNKNSASLTALSFLHILQKGLRFRITMIITALDELLLVFSQNNPIREAWETTPSRPVSLVSLYGPGLGISDIAIYRRHTFSVSLQPIRRLGLACVSLRSPPVQFRLFPLLYSPHPSLNPRLSTLLRKSVRRAAMQLPHFKLVPCKRRLESEWLY